MSVNLSGKRALVTGAASGIGRGIALTLLKYGATVTALDISRENLETLKKEQPTIETVAVDISDAKATKAAIKSVLPIDLLVNNAGIATAEPITEVTEEIFARVFNINVRPLFLVTQVIIEDLYRRNAPGAIVNMSSAAAKGGLPNRTIYCSSKGAVDGFTRALAFEVGPKNIRVNSVNPTVVMTDLGQRIWGDPKKQSDLLSKIALGRFADVENVSQTVAFLLSDHASMITGASIPVDGGYLAG